MLRKNYILLILFCFSIFIAKSDNHRKEDTLVVLKIVNTKFQTIIDNLLIHEKKMDYYNSDLVFYIDVQHRKGITLLSVGSTNKIMKSGYEIGCLTIKGKFFIVSSNCETNLFKNTQFKMKYNFYIPIESRKIDSEGVIIDIYEDDSYTQWNYRLKNGKLIKIP